MIVRAILPALIVPALFTTTGAHAQETTQCTLKRDQNRGPIPESVYYKSSADSNHSIAGGRIEQAVSAWNGCKASTPVMHHATKANPAPEGARVWTIVRGTYDYFKIDPTDTDARTHCGVTEYGQPRTIRVYQDAPTRICGENGEYLHKTLMHEMGHTIGLHHITRVDPGDADYANAQACRATKATMTDVSLDVRELSEEVDCKFAHEFLRDDHPVDCSETPDHEDCSDDDDDDDDDDGGGNPDIDCAGTDQGGCRPGRGDDGDETDACAFPAPGCPGYCDLNPFHRDCSPDCTLFPGDPRCGDVTWEVCWGRLEDTDGDGEFECVPAAYLRIGGDGKDPVVVTAAAASSRSYRIRLDHAGKLGVKLSGMSRDFDCKLYASPKPPGGEAPEALTDSTSASRCTNRGGTRDDSLEKSLPAGTHTLSVYPFTGGTGDYTLTLSYAADPLPSRVARILPFTSEVTTSSPSTFRFSLTESTNVSVLISELTADFDCRVEPKSECSNNRGTLDDSWSGTLGPATHSLTVYPHAGASGLFKLAVYRTGETPPSHDTDAGDGEGEDEEEHADTDESDDEDEDGEADDDEDTGGGEDEDTDPNTGDGEEDDGDDTSGDEDEDEEEDEPEPDPDPTPTVGRPGVPAITGSVVRQTQTVTWTEPATNGGAITRYQMAVRNSAAHSWRWTTAGSPSGSSNFAPTARSWSVTTPTGLLRHYRVRATNSAGDGEWSAYVELRSETPPPPPPDPEPDPEPEPPPPAAKPGAPTLTGSLASTQTHSLSWTAASSTIPISGYQMQTRNSSRHGWRFTTAGTPSPSSAFGPSVLAWRVTTPPGLHRQYRVRGRNASGYGSWSNVVSLTSGGGSGPSDALRGAADSDDGDDNGDGQADGCSDPSDPTVNDTLPRC